MGHGYIGLAFQGGQDNQGHCVVGLLLVTREMAWTGWRAWWRRARAMLVWPASRGRLMIRLRQTARAWGPAPILAWWRSSPRVTSRTQWRRFSIPQWPRSHRASSSGWAWAAFSVQIA